MDKFSSTGSQPPDDFEERLLAAARSFAYPPAPDLSQKPDFLEKSGFFLRRVGEKPHRGLALAGVILLALVIFFAAAPGARAAVLDWIRIGAVRIFAGGPTPTSTPTPTLAPASTRTPYPTLPPAPTPTPLASILDLSGETTLALAQVQAGFPVLLPAYPANLGLPDHVYYQDIGAPVVFLVWMEPGAAEIVRMSLTEALSGNVVFEKLVPNSVENTSVGGQPAVWIDAPYFLLTTSGDAAIARLVSEGHTLVWTSGGFTYRLEISSDLAEAIRTAESLQ